MDDKLIMEFSDLLSIYSYKIDALINLLIENNIVTKADFNNIAEKVMDKSKKDPDVDDYVIEEMKKKVFIK